MIEIAKNVGVLGMAVGTFFLIIKMIIPLLAPLNQKRSYRTINRIILFSFIIAVLGLLVYLLNPIAEGTGKAIESVGEILEDPERSLVTDTQISTIKARIAEEYINETVRDKKVISFITFKPRLYDSLIFKINKNDSEQLAKYARVMINNWSRSSEVTSSTPYQMGVEILMYDSIGLTWIRRRQRVQ